MSTASPDALVPFGPLRLAVGGDVLAVRQWTLAQSRWAARLLADAAPGPVLELCAGVGQIGLATIAVVPDRRLVQVEVMPEACELARRNAELNRLDDRVEVRCGDLAEAVAPQERFALALADPPYVPSAAVEQFPEDPEHAIDGGPDGLEVARRCVDVATSHLLPGASLVLQLGGSWQAERLDRSGLPAGVELVEVHDHGPDRTLARLVLRSDG